MTPLRLALHPLFPALALLVAGAGVVVTGSAATGPVLAVLAGCAAGFANSGST